MSESAIQTSQINELHTGEYQNENFKEESKVKVEDIEELFGVNKTMKWK